MTSTAKLPLADRMTRSKHQSVRGSKGIEGNGGEGKGGEGKGGEGKEGLLQGSPQVLVEVVGVPEHSVNVHRAAQIPGTYIGVESTTIGATTVG